MESLGIDIKLIIAQMINFGILLFILTKFVYKPLTKMLDNRKKSIDSALSNSQKIEKELNELEEKKSKMLQEALTAAHKEKEDLITVATNEKTKIIDQAKKMADLEVERSVARIKAAEEESLTLLKKRFSEEVASLVIQKFSKDKKYKGKFLDKVVSK